MENDKPMELDNVTVTVKDANGIYSQGGQLNIKNSIVTVSGSMTRDIQIFNSGQVKITDSTITSSGIAMLISERGTDAAHLEAENSTINGFTRVDGGATAKITNSTLNLFKKFTELGFLVDDSVQTTWGKTALTAINDNQTPTIVEVNDTDINVDLDDAHGIISVQEGALIDMTGGSITASGMNGAGVRILRRARVDLNDVDVTAIGDGSNGVSIADGGVFNASNSKIKTTGTSLLVQYGQAGSLQVADITLTNGTQLVENNGKWLEVQGASTANLTVDASTVKGSVAIEAASKANISLLKSITLDIDRRFNLNQPKP